MTRVLKTASPGDLALFWVDGGCAFAVVATVLEDGTTATAKRGSRAPRPRVLKGIALAVASEADCTFDVAKFVEETPDTFDTPQDAQRAARKWMADESPAAKRLDVAIANAEARS